MFKYTFNRLLIAGLLVSTTIPMTACTPVGTGVSTQLPSQVSLTLKKGYYAALGGAVGLEKAASLAVDMGLLKPGSPTAVKVADLLNDLKKAMDKADTAYKAANAFDLQNQVNQITSLTSSVKALLGVK